MNRDEAVPQSQAHVNGASYAGMPPPPFPRLNVARLRSLRAMSGELQRLAEIFWRQRGLLLIDPLTLPQDETRAEVVAEANRLYGRKGGR